MNSFTVPWGTYANLLGHVPVLANVTTNTIDPFDPVVAGGDALDLATLALDPLVVGGLLDLAAVRYVRFVDVAHDSGLDAFGNTIFYNSGATGTADVDAVAVIHHTGNTTASTAAIAHAAPTTPPIHVLASKANSSTGPLARLIRKVARA